MSLFADLVQRLADLLQPLFHASSSAVAIVLFTALVRLLVHPLSRATARTQRARAALQPKIAELRRRHGKNPEKLRKAVLDLHAEANISPVSGLLPSLLQLPAFFVLYRLFSNSTVGGRSNDLLTHALFAAPLGGRWTDALGHGGLLGPAGLVYLGLFALVAGIATYNYRRTKLVAAPVPAEGEGRVPGLGAVTAFLPFLSFFTLVTVAVVPLAAALYVVTSTAWSTVERALLHKEEADTARRDAIGTP
ncbi:YidC/Oxa1 family membrane protein insertase [Streptomyces sp. NPDC048664]|uniref:YidC/Oxa1 family membrane protein insertase n=1 Tax=Streptomyces sp. NPDC048664 TaxID=3154505 RepID=UPI003421046E